MTNEAPPQTDKAWTAGAAHGIGSGRREIRDGSAAPVHEPPKRWWPQKAPGGRSGR